MIEINLIPDVKQELINAQRIRATVISLSIIVGIAALVVVTLLALYVFGAQQLRQKLADDAIDKEYSTLSKTEDLANTLTIQNQLTKLSTMHQDKKIDSRIFDLLSTIIPPDPNSVAITKFSLDSEESTIKLEVQASNGYPALETFKKTIEATKLSYSVDGESDKKTVSLASNISDGERSYGDDETGKKVLRFTLTFKYSEELFARSSKDAVIIGPTRTNATDSYVGIPKSLFTTKATNLKEEK